MRLADLVAGLAIAAPLGEAADVEVTGVQHDSRAVVSGDLFAAIHGERFDGRAFAAEAAARGAVAAFGIGEAPAGLAIPWLPTPVPRLLLGPLAARAYGHPDRELKMAGVTGTNGKSTVATVLAAIFEAAGLRAGFIGTLGYRLGDRAFPGERTTPEASDLFRTLREMRQAGAAALAMEVSSHALSLGRVEGAAFDVGVFTNLTRDHLEYHGDMEGYFAAKRRLFALLKPGGRAVVNLDDPYGRRLVDEMRGEMPEALTYGAGGLVSARDVELTTGGIRAVFATPRGDLAVRSPLLGRYNLENLLAAAAGAEALDLPHEAIARAFAAQQPVAGRMEPVERGQPFPVFVDYAHTEAALAAALRSARDLSGGRVVVVFGCGGERDPGKRPGMGQIAGELADLAIATADNPRREDPEAILAAVEEGLRAAGRPYRIVPDRREAIRAAIETAASEEGWAVLVAGKGHEAVQVVGEQKIPFSDREEIARALEERFGPLARG